MTLCKFNNICWVNIALAPRESNVVTPKHASANIPVEKGAPITPNSAKIISTHGATTVIISREHESLYERSNQEGC